MKHQSEFPSNQVLLRFIVILNQILWLNVFADRSLNGRNMDKFACICLSLLIWLSTWTLRGSLDQIPMSEFVIAYCIDIPTEIRALMYWLITNAFFWNFAVNSGHLHHPSTYMLALNSSNCSTTASWYSSVFRWHNYRGCRASRKVKKKAHTETTTTKSSSTTTKATPATVWFLK